MLCSWTLHQAVSDLPLLVVAYFAGAAAACQGLVVLWGASVARRMAVLGDRPDAAVQHLALAARYAHESFLWHLKLGAVSLLVAAAVLATR